MFPGLPSSQRLAASITALALVGCSGERGGPSTATGDTPVRYVICSDGERDCFVVARFDTFESCESHKEISISLCDRRVPDRIVCTRNTATPLLARAYCTK